MRVYIYYLFLLLLLLTPFVPYLGTIDKIGSQWFFLSIINLCFFVFNIRSVDYFFYFKQFYLKIQSKLYLFFFIISIISISFALNRSVSLVDLSRIFICIISIIHLNIVLKKTNLSLLNFSYIISVIVFSEIIYSFFPLIDFILQNNFSSVDFENLSNNLKGVTGNKNVLAADLVFKSSFVLFLITISNSFKKLFSFFLLFLLTSLILLLSSRASYISFILIVVFFLIHTIISKSYSVKQLLSIVVPIIVSYIFINSIFNNTISVEGRLATISTTDTSTNQRLTLYDNAIDFISQNPFIGCGIGNWKIRSLPYWKDKLTGYSIPYHAHNDFLELTAELGLFGGIPYALIFACFFLLSLKHYIKKPSLCLVLFFSLTTVYFIDAFFNFPFERAISQVNFIILFSLSLLILNKKDEKNII